MYLVVADPPVPVAAPSTSGSVVFPHGETVVFERLVDGPADVFGNPTVVYAQPAAVAGCGFDPGGSVETYGPGRDVVVSSPRVFLPGGVTVTGLALSSRDRVTVRGLLYEVKGDPADWVNPFTGWAPGGVVELERVAG